MPLVKRKTNIEFTPLGGGREIGSNSYLVRIDGRDVILDCGVHPKKEGYPALPDFSLLTRAPDAAIISHGHVDHCGALPELIKRFPSVTPCATTATVSIMDRMLHNSVAVMGTLARERGIREYPLYSHEDVDSTIRRTLGIRLGQDFLINRRKDMTARFFHAGHVLGGASVLLRTPGHTLFYSGDICVADQELVAGLIPLDTSIKVDTLIIESTYGANAEADGVRYEDEIDRFAEAVRDVLEDGGVALVPSFALGRSQELLNIIARLQETGQLPDVPVLSSGLGRAIYEVYSLFPEYLRSDANLRPLSRFGRTGDTWNPRAVRKLLSEPTIIIATSGMMVENTPSALITQEMVRHTHHGIFFVGYLDPDSLGYKLLHCRPGDALQFQLDAPPVKVKLENIRWFYFSAHAPREALCNVIRRIQPKNVVFVHGDPGAIDWMYTHASNGCAKFAPTVGETIILET